MSRIKRGRPSPAILVAVIALVAALAGTALAGSGPSATTAASLKKVEKTADKAKKKAKKANKKAKAAQGDADAAQSSADAAQTSADAAQSSAGAAQGTADANGTKLACPPGTVYVLGGCLETAIRAGLGWLAADATCVGEGKRLPSIAERQQVAVNGKIPAAGTEWTNSFDGDGNASTVVPGGSASAKKIGLATDFRCALAPPG